MGLMSDNAVSGLVAKKKRDLRDRLEYICFIMQARQSAKMVALGSDFHGAQAEVT